MSIFPKKVAPEGPATDNWWIQGLKWVGSLVMQLIAIALTEEALEAHASMCIPRPQFTAGAAIVGCVQSLIIGAEDLVASSPLSTLAGTGKVFKTKFRQGRIMHLRVTLNPSAPLAKRGGMLAAAMLPLTLGENLDFAQTTDEKERWTFDDVCRLPRAVVQTTEKPLSLPYSPSPSDLAYKWMDLGFDRGQTETKMGGNKSVRYIVAYMDMSSNSADVSAEYALTESAYELVIDGRVELREISDDREIPILPYATRPFDQITICDYNNKYSVPIQEGTFCKGIFYHHKPVKEEAPDDGWSMTSTP
jgi:hypothetical protein